MRIKVSNFTIKYNLRAAHIGLETTAAAAARGTRMQTNKLSWLKLILTQMSQHGTLCVLSLQLTNIRLGLVTLLSPDVVEAVAVVVVVVVGVRLRSPGRAASN